MKLDVKNKYIRFIVSPKLQIIDFSKLYGTWFITFLLYFIIFTKYYFVICNSVNSIPLSTVDMYMYTVCINVYMYTYIYICIHSEISVVHKFPQNIEWISAEEMQVFSHEISSKNNIFAWLWLLWSYWNLINF